MAEQVTERDGFVVREFRTGREVDFVSCAMNVDTTRERVLAGLLRNMDTERFYVVDTRDEPSGGSA